ncbi:phage major capsid protein [Inquilinus limosus]|uniref:3-phosphoglycerate kinase n=1 Tax=Inquilinus limosus MP06 TaxID=1398085 RepID=A0A0A0DAG4_9PROT|nr:phage major capsid protein [Inquilinus limosus]KGM35711.1 3-phosphoglycerate kinase [Inquilinus limosus MP06]
MASPNLTEIVTTTLRNRSKKLADNVTKNNAALLRLEQKGNARPADGGRTLVEELEYAENGTFQYYSGYELLDVSPSDVFSAAEFDWKQAAVNVTISGLEGRIQNAGREKVIPLLAKRIKNAEKTMTNGIALGVYADGTGSAGKEIGGLKLLVADDPTTGTVGGINRATWSFWRNQVQSEAVFDKTTVQHNMNLLWLKCMRGRDKVDLILADNNAYTNYLESLQPIQRITNAKMADAGFTNLEYLGAPVVVDGAQGGGCPANHMYFLNTDYLYYRPHSDTNMVPMEEVRAINQDATVQAILWAGNMTLSNASLQGVYFKS